MKRRKPLEKMPWAYALSGGTFTVDLEPALCVESP